MSSNFNILWNNLRTSSPVWIESRTPTIVIGSTWKNQQQCTPKSEIRIPKKRYHKCPFSTVIQNLQVINVLIKYILQMRLLRDEISVKNFGANAHKFYFIHFCDVLSMIKCIPHCSTWCFLLSGSIADCSCTNCPCRRYNFSANRKN